MTDDHEYHQGIDGLPEPHGEWECCTGNCGDAFVSFGTWSLFGDCLKTARFRRNKTKAHVVDISKGWGNTTVITVCSNQENNLRSAIQTAIALLQHPGECAADRALQVLVEAVRR